jgi:hypothetical protein
MSFNKCIILISLLSFILSQNTNSSDLLSNFVENNKIGSDNNEMPKEEHNSTEEDTKT